MLYAMIMAGGGGTRFWPRSRMRRPKQFLTLSGDRSLLQQAFDRLEATTNAERIWVITSAAHVEETARQLPLLRSEQIVGEPMGRDTAACIGLGAALIARKDADGVMIVTPADHVIEPVQEFRRAAHVAAQVADENPQAIVTFGIPPTFPSTGYGYIQRGPESCQRQGIGVYQVKAFQEKPTRETAERFVASGEYYWNSGIFVWRARTILDALRRNKPALHDAVERIADAWPTAERDKVFAREYESIERISIDYAVLENAPEVLVVQTPYRWDDVGSWLAVERMNPQDADGNTILATHCGLRTKNCVIVGDSDRLLATIGVENLVIVQSGDAILVADRRDEGAVKQLVDRLKAEGWEAYL
jgi:mannose-1-phosphate guanylyltransferase